MKQTVNKCDAMLDAVKMPKKKNDAKHSEAWILVLWSASSQVTNNCFGKASTHLRRTTDEKEVWATTMLAERRQRKRSPRRTSKILNQQSRCCCLQIISERLLHYESLGWCRPTMPSSYKVKLYVAYFASLSWTSVLLYITIINKVSDFFFALLCDPFILLCTLFFRCYFATIYDIDKFDVADADYELFIFWLSSTVFHRNELAYSVPLPCINIISSAAE